MVIRASQPALRAEIVARVEREFPEDVVDLALAYLGCYGTSSWHSERERVHAAALDMAQGDVDRLMVAIERADSNYRDTLRQSGRD